METKTYLSTEQFIEVYESLSHEKKKELSAAWSAREAKTRLAACGTAWDEEWWEAWYEAWPEAWDVAWKAATDADLALRTKDLISDGYFLILTHPWTSCNLSLYAEGWADVLGGME